MNTSVTVDLPDELRDAYEAANRVPPGRWIFASLCLCALGLLCLLKPETVWQFQHLWTVRGGEPTDFYIVGTRIVGGIFIVTGIFSLAAAL
ncbi:MAG: hypothetical protein IJT31_00925 [Oscillibacter sp.]|nr:hypothetical protein [Oscillibacter sp.]